MILVSGCMAWFEVTDVHEKRCNRRNNSTIYKAGLWFLCMTDPLIVLYNCMHFTKIALMVVNLQSGHEIALQMTKGKTTPKISKAELWFMCMTHCLIVLFKCMKFQPHSFNSV